MMQTIALQREGQIVHLSQRLRAAGFTPRDRLEIERWVGQGRESMICHGDGGPYAMLYEGGKPWASWGVMRDGNELLLWDCVTFVDIGRFACMQEALAAIPCHGFPATTPLSNVIAFERFRASAG